LIAFLYLWLKVWEGIDKYWIVPVRKLFYFHHCTEHIAVVDEFIPSENTDIARSFIIT